MCVFLGRAMKKTGAQSRGGGDRPLAPPPRPSPPPWIRRCRDAGPNVMWEPALTVELSSHVGRDKTLQLTDNDLRFISFICLCDDPVLTCARKLSVKAA